MQRGQILRVIWKLLSPVWYICNVWVAFTNRVHTPLAVELSRCVQQRSLGSCFPLSPVWQLQWRDVPREASPGKWFCPTLLLPSGEGKSMLAVLKLEVTVPANSLPDVGPASVPRMAWEYIGSAESKTAAVSFCVGRECHKTSTAVPWRTVVSVVGKYAKFFG